MTSIVYLTAEQWGMRWARPSAAEKLPDAECYVHHTGGEMRDAAAAAFRRLNEYAINVKGYSALDYDVLVHYEPAGDVLTIGEGRGRWMSAATLDRNEQGEAVCIVGNFETRAPAAIEVEGVALGIVYGIRNGWITPDAQILGHRDNPAHPGATACPGKFLYAQLPTIRTRVAELLAPPRPPLIPSEDDMSTAVIARFHGFANSWLIGAGAPVHLSPELFAHYSGIGVPQVEQDYHPQLVGSLLHQCGLSGNDLVAL